MNEKQNLESMPFIKDKDVFKAVCYARSLNHMPIQKAMFKAAKYYKIDISEVAKYMGKFGSNRRDGITGKDANFN